MAVMGATPGQRNGAVPAADAVRALTLDPESAASVTACVQRARESARTVRDVVSTEMWEALNTLYLELDDSDLGAALRTGPYSVYSLVRERCALWWGLAEQTMLRDSAYSFLLAGRHTEAAGMMVRMLRVSLFPATVIGDDKGPGDEQALALLRAVGGLEAFRRSVAGPADPGRVGAFLTFERGYPHSIASSLNALLERLEAADAGHRQAPPLLRLARLRAELEFHRGLADSPLPDDADMGALMPELLEHVQTELGVIDGEISTRYFSGSAPQQQVLT